MKTMDCATLELLMENHERMNLIDIRSKQEFRAMHIPGARSLPFAELASPRGFCRYRPSIDQIYVISDDRVRASLAAGILRASGDMNAIVVDGGMKAWIQQGLPVLRSVFWSKLPAVLSAAAVLFAITGIALALAKFLLAAAILICAGAFLFQASLLLRAAVREPRRFSESKLDRAQRRGINDALPAHAC
jgi:rhodanese-related sulfurtransferase